MGLRSAALRATVPGDLIQHGHTGAYAHLAELLADTQGAVDKARADPAHK